MRNALDSKIKIETVFPEIGNRMASSRFASVPAIFSYAIQKKQARGRLLLTALQQSRDRRFSGLSGTAASGCRSP